MWTSLDCSGWQFTARTPHALHRPLASQGCTGPFAVGHLNDSLIRHVQLAGSRLERGHLRLQFLLIRRGLFQSIDSVVPQLAQGLGNLSPKGLMNKSRRINSSQSVDTFSNGVP